MSTAPTNELDNLFQNELQSINDDVRRKAALDAFRKLRPGNRVSIEEFLSSLQRHREMWAAVSTLNIVDFAEALAGRREVFLSAKPQTRRTRLSNNQKDELKDTILLVLSNYSAGRNRTEVAAAIIAGGLNHTDIDASELAEKLRQPLRDLVTEGKLHTVGEKRLMKYVSGGKHGK